MVRFVSSCPLANNAQLASPAPRHVVAFRHLGDRSRLLLRGAFDGNADSANHHVEVVHAAMTAKHGPGVVVLLLGWDHQVLHRVASPATGGAS